MAKVAENSRRRPSIIEMMVVIGTLVILAATTVTLANNYRDRPRDTLSTTGRVHPEIAVDGHGATAAIGQSTVLSQPLINLD